MICLIDFLEGGYNHWTGLLDWTTGLDYWTTGLTQTAKYNLFSAEQKLNFLISSVTSLTLLPTASFPEFLEIKVTYIFNKLHLGWLCLNPVEFKQALSTHELYQLEVNTYLLESTFIKL